MKMNDENPNINPTEVPESIKLKKTLEDALKKAEYSTKNAETGSNNDFGSLMLGFCMVLVLIVGLLGIIFADWSSFSFFYGQTGKEVIAKLLVGAFWGIFWIKLRGIVQDFVYPSHNKVLMKTIYRLSPELLKTKESEELAEATLHRNATSHWVGVLVFVLIGVGFLLFNPSFIAESSIVLGKGDVAAQVVRLILVCFAIGGYFSLRDLLIIKHEYGNLQIVLWKVQKLWPSHTGAALLQKSLPENHHSFTGRVVQTLYRMVQVQGRIKPEEIAAKSFQHGELLSVIPLYMTSVMPVLGLIGTILGLTLAIGGLEGVMSTALDDKEAFSGHISSSLSGIGTAFYTTLAGTFGMLIMKFFTLVVSHARSTFVVDLRNIILAEILPRVHSQNINSK